MPEDGQETRVEVAKSRRGVLVAMLGVVAVFAAIVAAAYVFNVGPFEALRGGTRAPASQHGSTDASASVDATASTVVTVPLPPAEAQEVMYWEQVASAAQIRDLADDRFAAFDLGPISVLDDRAEVRVSATYRDGGALKGTMLLRKYSEAWYFAMITRDGHPTITPTDGAADLAVARVIAEQQAVNQDVLKAILNGDYTKMTVDKTARGSGTATLDVTLSGGTAPEARAQIICISMTSGGSTRWFITAFSRL